MNTGGMKNIGMQYMNLAEAVWVTAILAAALELPILFPSGDLISIPELISPLLVKYKLIEEHVATVAKLAEGFNNCPNTVP